MSQPMSDETLVSTAEPLTDSEFAEWVATINSHAPLWARNDEDRWGAVRFSARVAATFAVHTEKAQETIASQNAEVAAARRNLSGALSDLAEHQAWIIDLKKRLVQKDEEIAKLRDEASQNGELLLQCVICWEPQVGHKREREGHDFERHASAPPPMTESEGEEQRRSFAFGNASIANVDVTRETVGQQADPELLAELLAALKRSLTR